MQNGKKGNQSGGNHIGERGKDLLSWEDGNHLKGGLIFALEAQSTLREKPEFLRGKEETHGQKEALFLNC